MQRIVTLDAVASQYVEQKIAAGQVASADAFVGALIQEKRAQEVAYENWFREKVMAGIVAAEAGEFASPEEIEATLRPWR
jgi:predicted transcriptional regulator